VRLEPRAVQPFVLGLEPFDDRGDALRVDRAGELDLDAPALTAVADVGESMPLVALDLHFGVEAPQLLEVGRPRVEPAVADVAALGARHEQPGRREEPGQRRHDHAPHSQLGREGGGVHRPRAAVGDQREVGRVAPLLRRDRPQRAHHRRVRQVVDAPCRLDRRQPEGPPGARQRPLRTLAVDRDLPVADRAGRDEPEQDVRVGDGRLVAAEAVARRAWHGARAPRPDVQALRRVEPRDRAAAGADLGDVDRRDPDQLAAAAEQAAPRRERGADLVLVAARDTPSLDQRRLRGRAAHVERDRVVVPERARQRERCDDAGRRPRLERVDRPSRRLIGRHDPAGRLHDREPRLYEPRLHEPLLQVGDVAGHQRPDVGVDDGRRRPLVLLLLAQDLARERHRHGGQLRAQDRADAPLVLGMKVRVEQAHGDRLHLCVAESRGERDDLVVVERSRDPPVCEHPLGELEAQVPLDERRRLRPEVVVEVRHPHPPQLEHVAEALGRDHRRTRAAPLEHRVRRDRRPVHDLVHVGERRERGGRLDDRAVVRRRRREHLAERDAAVVAGEDDVGEGAADVGAHPRHSGSSP
jgi:hypothetical protein